MTSQREHNPLARPTTELVTLPAPTAWPGILALGLALAAAGLVSSKIVSLVGIALCVVACVGWFVQVLPHERHELVPVDQEPVQVAVSRRTVARIAAAAEARSHRARLPLERLRTPRCPPSSAPRGSPLRLRRSRARPPMPGPSHSLRLRLRPRWSRRRPVLCRLHPP